MNRPLENPPVEHHPGHHSHDEREHWHEARFQGATAGPEQNPESPQPTPNSAAARSNARSGHSWLATRSPPPVSGEALQDQTKRGDGDEQGAAHNEHQGRVSVSGDVEETDELLRVHIPGTASLKPKSAPANNATSNIIL